MKNENAKTKKRLSLSFKLNLTSVLILLAFVAGIMFTAYQVQKQRVQDEYFSVADRASSYLADESSGFFLSMLRKAIETDEFIEVREKARASNEPKIVADWMKEHEIETVDILGENSSMKASDVYEVIGYPVTSAYQQFDISCAYFTYIKNGQAYYLAYPPNGLLDLGMPVPGYVYDKETDAAGGAGARVVKNGEETVCRSLVCMHESYYDKETQTFGYYFNDDDEEVFGIGTIDINMEYIMDASKHFLNNTIFITILLTAICIALNIILVRRFATRPLKDLSEATCGFGKDNTGYSYDDIIKVDIRSNDEINDLYQEIVAMQTRIVKYTSDLERLSAEKARNATELSLAANIQGSMLQDSSKAFPDCDAFRLAAAMDPAREVGGDFYDFFFIDETHLALVIADVSGKGIPASLFMMAAMMLLKGCSAPGSTPASILESVNNETCKNNTAEMFVTIWMGILDINTGHMVCSNAGHEFPAISDSDGKFELFKDKHGMVVGCMGGLKYRDYEIQLEPGGSIFVYTDGVPEADNKEHELYGTDRMLAVLNTEGLDTPDEILSAVRKDVDRFADGAEQFDDLTMLCLKWKG